MSVPSWKELLTIPDLLTLSNGVCGSLSIFLSISGDMGYAALFMLAAVFFDAIDGKVARHLHMQGRLGKDLDSLCDAISFGVAPAVFGYVNGLDAPLDVVILTIFVLSGVLRLARFNALSLQFFAGMPITLNGAMIPLAYVLGMFSHPWMIFFYAISSFCMLSSIRIPKL